jgi:phosphopantetheinyl transferase (holo-ACP synthase)
MKEAVLSIGNDLVFLKDPRRINRGRDIRLLKKILTESEQEIITNNSEADLLVWLLWSFKEAAYKYCKRSFPELVFAPKEFVILNISGGLLSFPVSKISNDLNRKGFEDLCKTVASVYTPNGILEANSVINKNYIHSVVCGSGAQMNDVVWGVKNIPHCSHNSQSVEVRRFAATSILKALETHGNPEITFAKNPIGYPEIFVNEIKHDIPLSFSHDNCYVSFAFLITS